MKSAKKSIRPIPSSMRGKKRYILFQLEAGHKLKPAEVSEAVWAAMLTLHGTAGSAQYRFWFVDYNPRSGKGVVRCAHDAVDQVRAALLFVEKVGEDKVTPHTLLTSGSLAKLKGKMQG